MSDNIKNSAKKPRSGQNPLPDGWSIVQCEHPAKQTHKKPVLLPPDVQEMQLNVLFLSDEIMKLRKGLNSFSRYLIYDKKELLPADLTALQDIALKQCTERYELRKQLGLTNL
jgi:hypothetical protein